VTIKVLLLKIQEPKIIAQSPGKTGSFQMAIQNPLCDQQKFKKTVPILVQGLYQNPSAGQTKPPFKKKLSVMCEYLKNSI